MLALYLQGIYAVKYITSIAVHWMELNLNLKNIIRLLFNLYYICLLLMYLYLINIMFLFDHNKQRSLHDYGKGIVILREIVHCVTFHDPCYIFYKSTWYKE